MDGKSLKDQALANHELNNVEWLKRMRRQFSLLVKKQGQAAVDELRAYAERLADKGIKPKSHNAWGSVPDRNLLKVAGYKKTKVKQGRARTIAVWSER